ncbi:hypothetical protein PVAND_017434 [Polypedilum vanderplanki]|uniref:Uncharacterized protein n=1 Tax=Polypedilum vanderplanki TaxID=319348 RepID=A0A9J6BJ11_POLVA|nr:hypothetical protein PVAND_017434 [Polypedilum vanderplanki]
MTKKILFAIFVVLILFDAVESFTANCNYKVSSYVIINSVYECHIFDIPITSENKDISVTGSHLSGRNNNDVTSIWIVSDWTLTFFPKNFSNFFPNIKVISIYYLSIEALYGDELNEFPNLELFEIISSNLTTISSRLFEKTPKIRVINFSYTSLERVGHDLFTPLNVLQIKWLAFYGNCINQYEWSYNQTAILSIIDELLEKCPFDDEENFFTTISLATTTEKNLACTDRNIEYLVCDLKNEIEGIQGNLKSKEERMDKFGSQLAQIQEDTQIKIREIEATFQNELTKMGEEMQVKDGKIQIFESRLKWMEEEVLRLTTNPCACK